MIEKRKKAAEAEARRLGYEVTWNANRMTIVRPSDKHSGELIVGTARAS